MMFVTYQLQLTLFATGGGGIRPPLDIFARKSEIVRRIFTKLGDFIHNAPTYVYI